MASRLYLLGVALILVAVGYQYRGHLQCLLNHWVADGSNSEPVEAPVPRDPGQAKKQSDHAKTNQLDTGTESESETPAIEPGRSESAPPTNAEAADGDAGSETGSSAGPDYYNPPFDPENPGEPLYAASGVRLITLNELAAHGPNGPLEPVWLALMGRVYDVQKGAEHYYGPKGGYNFFSGRDGTRAFVTGKFDDEGLIDDVEGLSPLELGEMENWLKFYDTDYTFVGKLIARYYNKDGSPTKAWYKYRKMLGEQEKIKALQKELEKRYPGCNSKWSEKEGGKVFCSEKSGGIQRDWVGYPRRFFAPGTKTWRCACIHKRDLDSPHVKPYPDCDPDSTLCQVDSKKMKELREQGL